MGSFGKNNIESAVIYCRVSSDKQVRQGNGLEGQENRCRQYAESHGYEVKEVFRDEAISGGSDFRPAFFKLLDFVEGIEGTVAVIFDDLSRLARDVVVARALKLQVAKVGGVLDCVSFEFEDTPENNLYETVLVATGEFERKKNRQRVISRQLSRMESGYWVFAPPRGYRYEKHTSGGKVLVPDEPNASIVKDAFEKYASGELSTQTDVALFFEKRGLLNRKRNKHRVSVHEAKRILRRVVYCGDIEYKKWKISRRVAKHEPLVTLEVFERVQDRINKRKKQVYKSDIDSDFPLRGLLRCSECGTQITASWSKGRNSRYPYYRCPNTKSCSASPKSDRKELVEGRFLDLLSSVAPSKGLLKLTRQITKDLLAAKSKDCKELAKERVREAQAVEAKIEGLVDQIERVASSSVIQRLERRIDTLENEKRRIVKEMSSLQTGFPSSQQVNGRVFDFLENPKRYWVAGDLKQKRLVQNLVFSESLKYSKQSGFGTANLSLPFKVLAMKDKNKRSLVVRPWVKPNDYWPFYWHLTERVKKEFDAHGIEIPFPQRVIRRQS